MKAKKIIYEKLFNLGNFSHEKISIELEVEAGEKAEHVLEKAKLFVEKNRSKNPEIENYEQAKRIMEDRDNQTYAAVDRARRTIEDYESRITEELPF